MDFKKRLLDNSPVRLEELFQLTKEELEMIAFPEEIEILLRKEHYYSLGWTHFNVELPKLLFEEFFTNFEETHCIFINREYRVYYCQNKKI